MRTCMFPEVIKYIHKRQPGNPHMIYSSPLLLGFLLEIKVKNYNVCN